MYQFNPYAIPNFFTVLFLTVLGTFIFSKNKKAIPNIIFTLLCFSAAIWQFGFAMEYLSKTKETALFWNRFVYLGVIFITPIMYHFTVSFLKLKKQKNFVYLFYIFAIIFVVLSRTDYFISGIRKYFWGYYTKVEILHHPFLIIWFTIGIASIVNMFKGYNSIDSSLERQRRKYMFLGSIIGLIGTIDFIPAYGIPLYPFGYIPVFLYMTLTGYSIIRYKAFEIETVIHKTAVWLFTFSFIITPVFLLYKWIFPHIKEYNVLQLSFWLVTFLFLAIYLRVIQPKIDHLFQRRRANLEEISRRFTEDLVHLKGLNQLIQRIEDTIADTLYPQRIDIFIYNEHKKNYKLANVIGGSTEITELKGEDGFLLWLAKNDKIAYREFVDIDPNYALIRKEANDYFYLTDAVVVIPLVLNEKLLGVINLGKKANLRRYNAIDLHFLTALKNQATIAIANSLLYENIEEQVRQRTKELVEVQKQLIQAEKLATVGTLAGGVAHEINNPLTAILTNVQMLLASDAVDDKLDKESLELIEEATKRCRTIVQKLMAYAKKPLEAAKISEVNLLNVLKGVVSFLGYQLEQENIKIVIEAKEDDYLVRGNYNELEQVVTNIILNAKDAIKQIKTSGDIHISLTKSGDWIKIEIRDEGIGMPKEMIPKIFDPFFTTKDVGKGTGLGLSICQAIIEKHNGIITVQSEPNKGSEFSVQLPRYHSS